MPRNPYKVEAEDTSLLGSLSAVDLLEKFMALMRQAVHAQIGVTGLARKPTSAETAMFMRTREAVDECKAEIQVRLGIQNAPEVVNRKAFMWLSKQLRAAVCQKCGSKTYYSKGLDFWSQDLSKPEPILRQMAFNGASIKQMEDALMFVECLCAKCAKRKGAFVTKYGKPDLKRYGILS